MNYWPHEDDPPAVAALKEIASYNADELHEWEEENAADMVEIARKAIVTFQAANPTMGKGWAESTYGAPEPGYDKP